MMNRRALAALALLFLPMSHLAASPADDLVGLGRQALESHQLKVANRYFHRALAVAPDHPEANVLFALTDLLGLVETPEAQKLLDRMGVSGQGRDVFHWTAKAPKAVPVDLSSDEFKSFAQSQLLPELLVAEERLSKVTAPGFKISLSPEETGLQAVEIDYADVLALKAMDQALIFAITALENYDTHFKIAEIERWLNTYDLTLENLLSTYPKLLTPIGSGSLRAAGAEFSKFVDAYAAASDAIRLRGTGTTSSSLFALDPEETAREARFRRNMEAIQRSLTAPAQIDDATQIYAGAFLSSIPSLRNLLPKFTYNHPWPGSFSDPSFGGSMPGYTQAQALDAFTRFGDYLDQLFAHSKETMLLPTVKISSPKANLEIPREGHPTLTVTGKASGKVGVARVDVGCVNLTTPPWVLLNPLTGNSLVTTATGTSPWTVTLSNIQPGANVLYAIAYDIWGRPSPPKTRAFTYLASGTYSLQCSPGGKIVSAPDHSPGPAWWLWGNSFWPTSDSRIDLNPFWHLCGGAKLSPVTSGTGRLGFKYRVKAVPDSGYVFKGWTSPNAWELQNGEFTLTDGFSAYATFVPNPYLTLAGSYNGIFGNGDPAGFASVSVSKTGAVKGTVTVGKNSFPFAGQLDLEGASDWICVSRGKSLSNLWVNLNLDLSSPDHSLSVTVEEEEEDGWDQFIGSGIATLGSPKTGALSLSCDEGGRIVPALEGTKELGITYTVNAVPNPGHMFSCWSVNGERFYDPTLTFTMVDGFSATAEFMETPFPGGLKYNTLLYHYDPDLGLGNTPTGLVSLAITESGAFTGKVIRSGTSYPLKGALDPNDYSAGLEVSDAEGSHWVYFSVDPDYASTLWFTFGDDQAQSTYPCVSSVTLPNRYTLDLAPDTDQSASIKPQGHGFATMGLSSAGSARISGKLADGTPFTQGGHLTSDSLLPVFIPISSQNGLFAGEVSLIDRSYGDPHDISLWGDFLWAKPPRSDPAAMGSYSNGFQAAITLQGSPWQPPSRNVWWLPYGWIFSVLDPSSGEDILDWSVDNSSNGEQFKTAPQAPKLTLRLNFSTGYFSGAFSQDRVATPTFFQGIMDANQSTGAGFYLKGGNSGAVLLAP